MEGASRAAFAAARQALDGAVRAGGSLAEVAQQLFAVTDALDGNTTLRRALTDPSRSDSDRVGLARTLFGSRLGAGALEVVTTAVGQRWTTDRDLADAVATLGIEAVLFDAEAAGELDRVEDELFRFERAVASDAELRDALAPRHDNATGKVALVTALLEGKVAAATMTLATRSVSAPRGQRIDQALAAILTQTAKHRDELTALVTVAAPLSPEQHDRLAASLQRHYGRRVSLQEVLDPHVVGGIRVQVGDEVLDGTVQRRLDAVRRELSGS